MTNPTASNIRLVDIGYGYGQTNGDVITPTLINAYSAMSVTPYWRGVNFIAENLASFPVYVSLTANGDAVKEHPLDVLLSTSPNNYQNSVVFWLTLFVHAVHAGKGFARIQRDKTGNAIAFHNWAPDDVLPFRVTFEGDDYPSQFYFIRSRNISVASSDMIHLQGISWDGMTAIDPVAMHQATLQRAATMDRYQTKFLQKGTVLKGSVEIPGSMTDEQLAQFKAHLRNNFTGPDAADDLLVLTDAAKLNNTTLSPEQSQLSAQAVATTKQIAQILGVDPVFLYERSDSKYSGIAEAGENVVRYTFRPRITQIEAELTIKLLTPAERAKGMRIEMDPDALTRGDIKTQTDVAVAKVGAGIWTINEARTYLGDPKSTDPEADKHKQRGDTAPPAQVAKPAAD